MTQPINPPAPVPQASTPPPAVSEVDFKALQAKLDEQAAHITKLNDENTKRRLAAKDDKQEAEKTTAQLSEELSVRDAALALKDAGAAGDSATVRRMVALLDSKDPVELSGAIERLKVAMPGLFPAPKAEKKDGEDDPEEEEKPPPVKRGNAPAPKEGVDTSSLDYVAQQLLGQARRKPGVRKG